MKRKYITGLLAVSFTVLMAVPSIAGSIEPMSKEELSSLSDKQAEERVLQLSKRVNELKETDLRNVPKDERKEIKNEMREIKKELDFLNDRVTLSVGALIIIILLIILIF